VEGGRLFVVKTIALAVALSSLIACSSSAPVPSFAEVPDASDAPDTSVAACNGYPIGPYGTKNGSTVRADLTWQGYPAGKTTSETIAMADLFDCDGNKGINALVFDVSATWCAACQAEAADMKTLLPQYNALGVKVITLIVQDASNQPATLLTANDWKKTYNLLDVAVCADPSFAFQPSGSGSISLPMEVLVDPRTMKVITTTYGYMSHYPLTPSADVVSLAKRNGAK
jgi:thiol-disulfide isomerase/thioredoxin